MESNSELAKQPDQAATDPTVRFEPAGEVGEELISNAVRMRATDIHVEPRHRDVQVRLRIDGRMEVFAHLTRDAGHALLNQWKIAANLSIADPFRPQEGRLEMPHVLRGHEARLTIALVHGGESAAVRLLDRRQLVRPILELGLGQRCLELVQRLVDHGEGVVLITGPTGVGKTTTLYSIIHALDNGDRNIVSIEDPVEFDVPSIQQMSVDLRHDVTFASGLKTLLRMDPDVVMIGEIRDPETAAVAMRAASSGKYVLTTFHTRDIASTVTGLRDLQVDSRSLAGNLRGIVAQRLVRRLCTACKQECEISEEQRAVFAKHAVPAPTHLFVPVGCDQCRKTGYFGRIGVFEVEVNNRQLAEAIEGNQPEDAIRDLLSSQGSPTLAQDGLCKVAEGITSLSEAMHMSWVEL